jgi:allantoin racemase
MKIKVINPNTTQSMTRKIAAAAWACASPGTEIVAVSPARGPRSIETQHDEAVAAIGVLDEIAAGDAAGFDGYVIACFGDPGLPAAREMARAPVVGIAEAAMKVASLVSDGFTIISMPAHALVGMERLVHAYDMGRKCRRIRMLDMPVLDLEEDASSSRRLLLAECHRALTEDHSDCVLLGCAGMSDAAAEITREIGAPAIDGVAAAVKMVEALVSLGLGARGRGAPRESAA